MRADALAVAQLGVIADIGGYGSRIGARCTRLSGTTEVDSNFQTQLRIPAALIAPEPCMNFRPEKQRAQGKPDAQLHPQPRAQSVESTRVSHHRFADSPGLPCAMVLTAYSVLSSAT